MTTTDIESARSNLFKLAERVVKLNDRINVTTKNGSFIMISEAEYTGLMETLYLYSIPGMKESIVEGMKTPTEECIKLDWKKELQTP